MNITALLYPVLSLGGLGILFGLGLGYAGIKFKVETDPKLPLIRDALPGANCGGCGYAGCDAFADAVVKGQARPNGCPVGGAATVQSISEIMGVSVELAAKRAAYVKCAGDCDKAKNQYEYVGLNNCASAAQLAGGGLKECAYGCIGAGSCAAACNYGAITLENGIAVVDPKKCTTCGMCVSTCPKKLIEIIPCEVKAENGGGQAATYRPVRVACNSADPGKVVRGLCSIGCIACKLCEKACDFDAIHVNNNIAKVDYNKCTACGECVVKCPTKVIMTQDVK